jgi:hypothetical protein
MTIAIRAAIIGLACSLCACTTSPHPPPSPEPAAPEPALSAAPPGDEAPEYTVRAVIPPTPAMLKAALSNDPDAMRDAVATQAACQATSTCPAQFGACTAWSTTTLCSSTCGPGFCLCKPIRLCEGEPPEPKGQDTYNAFRVCFDANQNACTEWLNTSVTVCGC